MIELSEEIKHAFKNHARREFPREACGLVAIVKGRQQYYECKNIAESNNDFILDPRDYIRVDDLVSSLAGDIVVVVHSHPVTSSLPSMADKVGCEQSGLEWAIYSSKEGFDEWYQFEPKGYKAPLVGRTFKHGIFDCYSALRDWYFENMGVNIPDFERDVRWWDKGQNLLMDNFSKAGFYEVKDGTIERGDVLLVNVASPVVNHCAVYIGNDQVFHQTMNRLSGREIYGGLLKKNTRMTLRYAK